MTHPINVDIDEQWIRDRFANMLIDMAEELSPRDTLRTRRPPHGTCGWWVPPSLGMSGFDHPAGQFGNRVSKVLSGLIYRRTISDTICFTSVSSAMP